MSERPDEAELKRAINNKLWEKLPPDTTLQQAEDIACDIFRLLNGEWDQWQKRQDSRPEAKLAD
jgi:hypothetical protein